MAGQTSLTVVDLGEDRWLDFLRRTDRAFQSTRRTTEADLAPRRERFAGQRFSGVVDAGRLVATYRSWDAPVTVPGGSVVTDMVSGVTVEPTRRRRGLLTAMVLRDLRRAREAGTPMAMLVAAEAPIYGRFGFGRAMGSATWRVDLPAPMAAVLPEGTDDVDVELVEDADLAGVAPGVYAAAAAGQPGAITLDAINFDVMLGTVAVPGEDADRLRPALVARSGGEVVGYARYRLPETWSAGSFVSEMTVDDLVATTAAALAALWRQLLTMDLTVRVTAAQRPASDPLPELLADRRRATATTHEDVYWVRLLDVPAALEARRASAPVDVVVDVADPMGLSGGRWRVRAADRAGSTGLPVEVTATTEDPDLALDVATLSSAYLGETPLVRLRSAGRVVEHTSGAVRRLGAALAWEPTASPTLHGF